MARKRNRKRTMPMPKIKPDPDEVKEFCPCSMVRYNNSPQCYSTFWICRVCLSAILSEDGVRDHLLRCNPDIMRAKAAAEFMFNPEYKCDVCSMVFKRLVVLNKHKLEHESKKEEDDDEEPRRRKNRSKKMMVPPLKIKKEKI